MSDQNAKLVQLVTEVVRQEIHTQLGGVLKLLNQDLEATFNEFNTRMNDLLTRIEMLEGATPAPAQAPKPESVEL